MGLITGGQNNGAQQQMQQMGYSDEEQRKAKLQMMTTKLRRYWRFICLGIFLFLTIGMYMESKDNSLIACIAMSAFGSLLIYVTVLYIYIYIIAGSALKFFLYIRDLFTSKGTKI